MPLTSTLLQTKIPFMAMIFPNVSGLCKQDNAPCYTTQIVQEWFEEHDMEQEHEEHVYLQHASTVSGMIQCYTSLHVQYNWVYDE